MQITSIESKLLTEIRYLNAGRGPGDFYNDIVPVHRGYVDALPDGTSAIAVTADLQGRETFESAGGHPLRLLGEVLPRMLRADVLPELDLPSGDIGVLLAGDFYTVPALDKRGGSGDVRPDVPDIGFRGSPRIRQVFERSENTLVVNYGVEIALGHFISPVSASPLPKLLSTSARCMDRTGIQRSSNASTD